MTYLYVPITQLVLKYMYAKVRINIQIIQSYIPLTQQKPYATFLKLDRGYKN